MSITLVGSNSEDPAEWVLYNRSLMVSKTQGKLPSMSDDIMLLNFLSHRRIKAV